MMSLVHIVNSSFERQTVREVQGAVCFRADSCIMFRKAYLLWGYGFLRGLVQLLNRLLVISKIFLTSNEDDWETLAEM